MTTREIAPTAGVRFTVASRPQRRFSQTQSVSNLAGSTSFAPIPLPATGYVRSVELYFEQSMTCASAAALVAGDGPWNLISAVSITDATGQNIIAPISGYNLYLVNKWLPSGGINTNTPLPWTSNPHLGPEYAFATVSTTGATAKFRLSLDFEQDAATGYGCIPNLDSNASLLLKVDVAQYSVAVTGTTVSAATLSVRVEQHYWAPTSATIGGQPAQQTPPGYGDYVETRYETQTVSAQSENTVNVNNRGGLIRGIIAVSRASGTRTAFTAGSNVGLVFDNNSVDEGITLASHQDHMRRQRGYVGADLTTSYAPLTAGVLPGADTGALVWDFGSESTGRDSWLNTRVGTLLQLKLTPGASATQLELIVLLAQVRDAEAFYAA